MNKKEKAKRIAVALERVTALRQHMKSRIDEYADVLDSVNDSHREYFGLYMNDTLNIIMDMIYHSNLTLADIPQVVRMNIQLYGQVLQDEGRVDQTINHMIDDILWATASKDHPLYFVGWFDMMLLLESCLQFERGLIFNETVEKLSQAIETLESRAR